MFFNRLRFKFKFQSYLKYTPININLTYFLSLFEILIHFFLEASNLPQYIAKTKKGLVYIYCLQIIIKLFKRFASMILVTKFLLNMKSKAFHDFKLEYMKKNLEFDF